MSIEIRHLRTFVAVAEELHFTRAADRLRIAQPALSAQIKRLEQQLQLPLFERSTRLVRLTPQGEEFYSAARVAVEKWDESLIVAASLRRGRGGAVSLGVSLRIHSRTRGEIQRSVGSINSGVTVDFVAESTPRLIEEVAAGRLDAALCIAPNHEAGVRFQLVRDDPLVVALPWNSPLASRDSLALTDLRNEAWIMPNRLFGSTTILRDMVRAGGFEPTIAAGSAADYDDEFTAVASGVGIEVIPSAIMSPRPVDGVVFVPIDDHSIPLEVAYLSDPPGQLISSVIRAVLDSQNTAPRVPVLHPMQRNVVID